MEIFADTLKPDETKPWDDYVLGHPHATLYQLSGWRNVIERSYGHKTYYLAARGGTRKKVLGILPLVHLKHFFFGNRLVSLPFVDYGGILSDGREAERALLQESIRLAEAFGAGAVELRNPSPTPDPDFDLLPKNRSMITHMKSHKVRMLLPLQGSSEALMKSFKSKLRSQIKKSIRDGLVVRKGGLDLLDDFYSVFAHNMRDLGSPVHAKAILRNVLEVFHDRAFAVVVYMDGISIAAGIMIGFGDTMANPWASFRKEFKKLNPNMLLYWSMLEHASDNGYACFDFGRSTPEEGTYNFKRQWGAEPVPLHWHYIALNGKAGAGSPAKDIAFEYASRIWKKLPVSMTCILGPRLRKHIDL
jgi:serine/alanine adding enzyme